MILELAAVEEEDVIGRVERSLGGQARPELEHDLAHSRKGHQSVVLGGLAQWHAARHGALEVAQQGSQEAR